MSGKTALQVALKLAAIRTLVAEQAEDEALWFRPVHVTEDYLQRALRELHAVIEAEP